MNFKVYIIGKIKNKNQLAAIKEYDKRLSRYCKIKLIQLKDISEIENLPDKSYKILINENADTISSEELAEKIEHLGLTGKSDISILLINDSIKNDEHIALSKMSLSTGMATTVLFEQIYRAFRIMKNEPYHK